MVDTKVLDLSLLWREKVRPQVSHVSEGTSSQSWRGEHAQPDHTGAQWPRDKNSSSPFRGSRAQQGVPQKSLKSE